MECCLLSFLNEVVCVPVSSLFVFMLWLPKRHWSFRLKGFSDNYLGFLMCQNNCYSLPRYIKIKVRKPTAGLWQKLNPGECHKPQRSPTTLVALIFLPALLRKYLETVYPAVYVAVGPPTFRNSSISQQVYDSQTGGRRVDSSLVNFSEPFFFFCLFFFLFWKVHIVGT